MLKLSRSRLCTRQLRAQHIATMRTGACCSQRRQQQPTHAVLMPPPQRRGVQPPAGGLVAGAAKWRASAPITWRESSTGRGGPLSRLTWLACAGEAAGTTDAAAAREGTPAARGCSWTARSASVGGGALERTTAPAAQSGGRRAPRVRGHAWCRCAVRGVQDAARTVWDVGVRQAGSGDASALSSNDAPNA